MLAANKLEVSTIPSIYNFHYLTFYGTIGLFFMNNDNALTLSEAKPVTGIKNIEVPTPQKYSNAWYTINGQRLNGEPTQRGIYIHNGQKFVVK